ncbi:MAG: hypothetical protein KatS3mg109_1228 [Pirellulaceae bacterium]|nr:MAG: hypothetical protein KatS3mg109_1228 [Pirellulaceae bacterium]GIW94857.1 MAG: hypothetical protein KatS3mg110_2898 [Pirellulaceae bacterium]
MTALLQHFPVWMSLCAAGLVVVFSVATPIGELAAQEELTGDEARQYALMLCDGFDKNRQAFQRFTCRFTVVCGSAKCGGEWWTKDSWDGNVETVSQVADGLLVKDGKVFRYSIVPRPPASPPKGVDHPKQDRGNSAVDLSRGFSLGCFPEDHILADNEYILSEAPIGPQAIISRRSDWDRALWSMRTPWHPVFLNEYAYLDWLRRIIGPAPTRSGAKFRVIRGAPVGPHRLTIVDLGTDFYIDESRGYMPIKMVDFEYVLDKLGGTPRLGDRVVALFTEVSQVKGYGWFPMKWTSVSGRRDKTTCLIFQLQVTELTMGRPKPELLQLKIRAGRHLIDQKNATKLRDLVIDQDTFVTAKDLPKLLDRYYNPSKYLGSIGPRRRPAVWAWLLWGFCGVVAAIGGTYLYIRRVRSGRR